MNTTAAALKAKVTTDTIRAWCRKGVIAAAKAAGRWVIDATSLAARIAIDSMKRPAPTEATPAIDLGATYTVTWASNTEPTTLTPVVKRRTIRRTGANTISISHLAPLFADHFDAITDEGDRAHALHVFASAILVISDQPDYDWTGDRQAREDGRLRTSYRGDIRGLSIDDVLDVAAQLRTQLAF
jgi:hypothetical protein